MSRREHHAAGCIVSGRRRKRNTRFSSGTEAFDAAWDAWFSELVAIAGLAAPFEPLMELWRTGYLLNSVGPDALVLVAPGANTTR